MARKANGTRKVRAELEGAVLELIDFEEVIPFVILRIEQALRRADLDDLLTPALDDLKRGTKSVRTAKDQVAGVASLFEER